MARPGSSPSGRRDDLGEPSLCNIEILPIGQDQRVLTATRLLPLWAAVGLVPGVAALASGEQGVGPSLAGLAGGAAVAALLAAGVVATPARYGLAFAPVARAAYGSRGAMLVLVVRWICGVFWLATALEALGRWGGLLLAAALPLPPVLQSDLGLRAVGWGCALLPLVLAGWVALGGMSRVTRILTPALALALLVAFGLVVFAGIASRGFGPWFGRSSAWGLREVTGIAGTAVTLLLIGIPSGMDWERFRRTSGGRSSWGHWAAAAAPFGMVPTAVGVAFVGALLASASQAVRGRADAALVADAAGFGGIVGGGVAALLVVLLLVIAAAPIGFYGSGLALCGLPARRLSYHAALMVTGGAAAVLLPLVGPLSARGVDAVTLGVLLAPVIGVLLADTLVVRRTRVVLEDLYLHSPGYGPLGGITVSAVVATLVGWASHPWVMARWLDWIDLGPLGPWGEVGTSAALAAPRALVVAALAYLAFGPLERAVASALRRALRRRQERGKNELAIISDASTTAGVTNPHFTHDAGDKAKRDDDWGL